MGVTLPKEKMKRVMRWRLVGVPGQHLTHQELVEVCAAATSTTPCLDSAVKLITRSRAAAASAKAAAAGAKVAAAAPAKVAVEGTAQAAAGAKAVKAKAPDAAKAEDVKAATAKVAVVGAAKAAAITAGAAVAGVAADTTVKRKKQKVVKTPVAADTEPGKVDSASEKEPLPTLPPKATVPQQPPSALQVSAAAAAAAEAEAEAAGKTEPKAGKGSREEHGTAALNDSMVSTPVAITQQVLGGSTGSGTSSGTSKTLSNSHSNRAQPGAAKKGLLAAARRATEPPTPIPPVAPIPSNTSAPAPVPVSAPAATPAPAAPALAATCPTPRAGGVVLPTPLPSAPPQLVPHHPPRPPSGPAPLSPQGPPPASAQQGPPPRAASPVSDMVRGVTAGAKPELATPGPTHTPGSGAGGSRPTGATPTPVHSATRQEDIIKLARGSPVIKASGVSQRQRGALSLTSGSSASGASGQQQAQQPHQLLQPQKSADAAAAATIAELSPLPPGEVPEARALLSPELQAWWSGVRARPGLVCPDLSQGLEALPIPVFISTNNEQRCGVQGAAAGGSNGSGGATAAGRETMPMDQLYAMLGLGSTGASGASNGAVALGQSMGVGALSDSGATGSAGAAAGGSGGGAWRYTRDCVWRLGALETVSVRAGLMSWVAPCWAGWGESTLDLFSWESVGC